jgi:hypothetical protein
MMCGRSSDCIFFYLPNPDVKFASDDDHHHLRGGGEPAEDRSLQKNWSNDCAKETFPEKNLVDLREKHCCGTK